jgi:outer membrane receptor protein involved in Fe transport
MQQSTKIAMAVALALQAMSTLAQAQAVTETQPATPAQRVEITGSRIRQVDLETAQPVQVMTQEQIQKSGLVTVGDIINNISSAGTRYTRLGAMIYSDLSLGYALPWKGKLLVGANNVFNRKSIVVYDANTAYTYGTSSSSSVDPERPIDRFFYMRYNQAF